MANEATVFFVVCPECGDKVPLPPQSVGENRSDLWNVVACLECNYPIDYDCDQIDSMPWIQWYELLQSKVLSRAE
ncbi:MAG: hypothetical protein SFV81_17390 [Pirellulaceae bacterium]|nr:hypothetical protein [Pirellulaceae bacterium]